MRKINNLTSGVYSITSKDGKILYIGASSDIEKRYLSHYGRLNNGNHDNLLLQDFCNYYGFDNLSFKTICMCEEQELMYFEKILIQALSPVCNKAHSPLNNILKEKVIQKPKNTHDKEYKTIDEYLTNNKLKKYQYIRMNGIAQDYIKTFDIITDIYKKYKIEISAKKISYVLKNIGYYKKQLPNGERVWIKK